MLTVILPDGSQKQFDRAVSSYDVAAEIGAGLAKAAVLAEVDGQQRDLHAPLPADGIRGISSLDVAADETGRIEPDVDLRIVVTE